MQNHNSIRNYAWIILILTTLAVLASLGFGRFSFGAILPFMKDGLQFNYSETGIVASAVFFGYLISAMLSGYFVNRYTHKRVIVFFQFFIAAGMFWSATAQGFWSALAACFIIGLGAGGAYVPSLGLLAEWFPPEKRGMATGTAMSGSGIGIVISGMVVPWIVTLQDGQGWRISWFILAVIVLAITLLNLFWLKHPPKGERSVTISKNNESIKPETGTSTASEQSKQDRVYRNPKIWAIGLIYLTWGFSYIIFSTFIVDYLMLDGGFAEVTAGQMFALAGMVSILSGSLWGHISDRIGRIRTLIIVYSLQAAVLAGFASSVHPAWLFAGIVLYAASLWAVPTIMMVVVGDYVSSGRVAVAMGFVTLFFGIGQFISPIITGWMVDQTHSYASAFLLSAAVCGSGAAGSILFYRRQTVEQIKTSTHS